jgi:BirA family biotin operon repressor/biotin-[acetyl-CoA-carboxylase] ligase
MGINRTLTEADLPVPTATSLALAAAAAGPPATVPTPNALVGAVLAVLDLLVGRWQSGVDEVATAAAYRERCVTLGRQVRVLLGGDRSVTGVAEEIDTTGRLVLRTSAGRQVFGAGDVVHLRS